MAKLTDLWRRLTEPPASVVSPERRRQIRLLCGLMLVLIPLAFLSISVEALLFAKFWPTFVAVSVALLFLLGVYGLARAGQFTSAALIAVGVTMATGFGIVWLNPGDALNYAFLYVNIFLAGMLFAETGVWLSALANIVLVAVVLPAMGFPPPHDDPLVAPIFLVLASTLLLVNIRHRNAVERDRQAELAAGEARFRALFHSSPAVMALSRFKDSRLRDVNRAFEEWSGWNRAELIGHTTLDLGFWPDPEERARVRALLADDASIRDVELRVRIRSGEMRDLLCSLEALQVENEDYMLVTVVDITERKRAEQETRRLNRLLGTLGAINPVLVRAGNEAQLFAEICRTLVQQGQFSMAWIGLAEVATQRVRVACQTGFRHGYLENLDVRYDDTPQGQGPTGTAIRSGQTVINDDTETNARFAPWRERAHEHGYRSSAAIPLRVHGQVVGSLNVYAVVPHSFGSQEVLLLEKLTGDIGMAVERLRAMAHIEASERELATILQNMQDTYYRTDLDGRIVRASAAATKLLGYTPREIEGQRLADFYVDPDGRAQFLAALEATGGVLQNYEAELRHRDGSLLWVSTNAQYVRDADGRVVGIEGTTRDITDRRRAEEALRDSEVRYRNIVETAQEGIWQIDTDSRTVFVNRKMAELLGYTVAEMSGRSLFDFMDDEGRVFAAQNVERRKQGIAEQHEFKFQRKDGSEIWAELIATPLFDSAGGYVGALAMVTDSTERRRADQALRASEQLLRLSQSLAHIGSWQWNPATGEVGWSEEMYQIYGVPQTEEPIQFDRVMAAIHPDDRERITQEVGTLLADQTSNNFECRIVRPDGKVRHVWARSEVQRAADGSPLRVIGTVQDVTARKRAEDSLLEVARGVSATTGESFFHSLVEHLARALQADHAFVGALIPDREDHIRTIAMLANGRHVDNFEYRLAGTPCRNVVGRKTCAYPRDVQSQFPGDRLLGEMGAHAYVGTPLFGADGAALGLVAVLYDHPIEQDATIGSTLEIFAARAAAELERLNAEERMIKLSGAIEQTADSVMITDRNGVIEYVNPAFERTTGYTRAEVIGETPRLVKSGRQGASFYEKLWQTLLAGNAFSEVFVNRRKDGGLYYEEKTITPVKDLGGRITHFVSTGKDVTERIQTQERLQHMAQHDALTELPNRALLLDRLKQSMARARWHQRLVAVLFVDLDRFKTINDTLGHDVGDRLLQQLAERFGRCVREGDTVARFGGDEFVILLDDVASEPDVSGVAQKALDVLGAPFTVDNQKLYITASIGVSLFPNDGEDSGTLLKNADIAMYRAKELGKNTYQFYSSDMSARAFERLSLETSLRNALERREFVLHYQPQIDSDTGAIVGVEVLIRWRHPEFGIVPPADFIPLLEETGLIVPAGEWVLDTACKQLHAWHEAGWPELRLAVNLSPRQFHTAGLEATIERSLDCIGRDPGLLELEITEGVILAHTRASLDTLAALRALGVRLAIDDFGTGYSSLSYLRRFPIDTLKIDRSFVQDIPGDADDSAITTTIIVLAQNLKLDVIAEGVENEAQRDFLRRQGCRLMQGYLFSRPLPAEEITRVLEQRKR